MWTQIRKNYKGNGDIFNKKAIVDIMEKRSKKRQIYTKGTFTKTFKYFFEEKIWQLARVQHDDTAFNLVNFNQIIKRTLLDRMKRLHEVANESQNGK